jgi:nucleotidyltransferase substrate binding protein (TIGR01987 family)
MQFSGDTRWKQRFQNFCKAFRLLEEAVSLQREKGLSDLEEQGLIQRFEFTHELAWNVMKDYFEYQGNTQITGSRDATLVAFSANIITTGEAWMDMIISRNKWPHTYNETIAEELKEKITKEYYPLFLAFKTKMHEFEVHEEL